MATGRIYKALSGFFYVKENDALIPCRARGKFKHEGVTPLVGDEVEYSSLGGQGIIDAVLPRKNEFLRPPVANLDVLVIIASRAIPVTDPFLVDKMTAIAEHNGVEPVVLVNKSDLIIGSSFADIYRRAGFKTVEAQSFREHSIYLFYRNRVEIQLPEHLIKLSVFYGGLFSLTSRF